jgi:hypothetical protein
MASPVKDRVGKIGLNTGDKRRGQMKHAVISTHKIYIEREMCRGKQT